MTAAGVQTNDSSAYLPPPPSTSTADAKGTGAAGNLSTDAPAADAHGAPSDFQSELQMQQSGQKETGSAQFASTQAGTAKTGSGKPWKKRDARTDNANPPAVTPVQVAEPQKPILPVSLALPQAQENIKPDQNTQLDQKTTPDDIAQGAAQQPAQPLLPSAAAVAQLPELQQPAALKQSAVTKQPAKLRQSVPSVDALPTSAANVAPSAAPDSPKVQVLPLTSSLPPAPLPVTVNVTKTEDPSSQDSVSTSAKPGASSESQPVSPVEVQLPAAPADPAASAVQETVDSAPSSPSALAFAARISAVQQKVDQPVVASSSQTPVQSPAVSGSQTAVEIPMRYAATAQIIQSAALGTQQDGPKKDSGDSSDRFARADARNDGARTDMVLPQFETMSQSAPSSGAAAPQQSAPAAQPGTLIEPPTTPPTSSHDIRVQVPDNNGGSTQVRFVESGGEVRVSVRTADDGLAQNLRTHLNDLTQRLSDGGMPAEMWKPASNAASSQSDSHQPNQDGSGSSGQGSGGQSGQQDRQQKRPAWLDEMEASLQGEQN
jgi:hypothetical protein